MRRSVLLRVVKANGLEYQEPDALRQRTNEEIRGGKVPPQVMEVVVEDLIPMPCLFERPVKKPR